MRDIRIFVPAPLVAGKNIELDERSTHYLLNVLRLKDGQAITLFNGDGLDYGATLFIPGRKRANAQVETGRQIDSESPLFTTLAICMSKGERMDYAVQKAAELGVNRIVPLRSARVALKLAADRQARKLDHWRQVAISACEQSGRSAVVDVLEPMELQHWLAQEKHASNRGETEAARILLDLQGRSFNAFAEAFPTLQSVALLVGAEGGFTDAELQLAEVSGFARVCLGRRTLRTETAPAVALALLQSRWGDLA